MTPERRPWKEELAIIDRTMKAISGVIDPEELVTIYWDNIGDLLPITDYVSVSRRDVEPPFYLVTRSSRFTEHHNPWTQRERLAVQEQGVEPLDPEQLQRAPAAPWRHRLGNAVRVEHQQVPLVERDREQLRGVHQPNPERGGGF